MVPDSPPGVAYAHRFPVASGDAYGSLAPYYDRLTDDYAYDRWLGELEGLAASHGLRGRRLLDVACGTGKSFMPLLARGYEVSACDLSPGMVALAQEKVPALRRRVLAADMRALPDIGSFDLITCLDDAVNHLLSDRDLRQTMRSLAARLAPGGIAIFDVNSLRTYRDFFSGDCELGGSEGLGFAFRGQTASDFAPGTVAAATIEVNIATAAGRARVRSHQRQCHHPRRRITAACAAAGLQIRAVVGQLPGARLMPDADEGRHTKLVYVLAKPKA